MKIVLKNIYNFKKYLPLVLFGLLTFFMPMQKQWHKSLDKVGEKISSTAYPFDSYFAGKMQFSSGDLFILLLFTFGLARIKNRSRGFLSLIRNLALVGYLASCLMSIILSQHNNYVVSYYVFLRYALFWGLYWIISEGLIEKSFSKIASVFLASTALSATMQAIISIGQYFKQYSLGLKSLGETRFAREGKSLISFDMDPASLWIFGESFPKDVKHEVLRSFGTFPHPNILGWYLAMGAIATFYLFEKAKDQKTKMLFSFIMMLQVFALFTSYSRSALLGLIFSLPIYVIFNDDWKKAFFYSLLPLSCVFLSTILLCPQLMARSQYATIIPVFVTYVIFALAGCLTGLMIKLCNKVSFSDVKSLILMFLEKKKGLLNAAIFLITLGLIYAGVIYKYSYLKGALFNLTDEYRLVNPLIAIKMTLAHPFIGTGFSMYLMHMKEFIPPSVNHNIGMIVHNVFMMVSAETGIMGLSCFLILIFSPLGSLRKVRVNKETLYLKVILCTTLFVGMCDMHFLIFVQGRLFFFSLLGLLALSAECSRCPIKQTNEHIVQAK